MNVLVIGGGGREHALCLALARDPGVTGLYCAPGNAGIAQVAQVLEVDATDPVAVADLATRLGVDLVVVGPEAPLVAGAADVLAERGVPCFGPSRAAARIESSKEYAKDVMAAAKVATARARACTSEAEVAAALTEFGAPYVVKDDGLAAGKGVVVTSDREAALAHARGCQRVLVEEYLAGPEVSLFAVTDGAHVVPLAPAQDFKRFGDGDTGPNTGGMGAYSPLDWVDAGLVEEVERDVLRPVVAELARRSTPFVGLLYAGLVLTEAGPKVIEFNCRFGDPETQVVLARLRTPLAGLLLAAATDRLAEVGPLDWDPWAAVTVVMAAAGYPATPRTGDPVGGLAAAAALDGVHVVHAATATDPAGGDPVTAGGRVLAVTALGPDLAGARERAYAGVARIRFEGATYRTDIAADR